MDPYQHTIFEKSITGELIMFEHEPDLLTRKEAQDLLRVGKNTILNLIYDGYLPASVIANSYRIKKKDLIHYIENKTLETYR